MTTSGEKALMARISETPFVKAADGEAF